MSGARRFPLITALVLLLSLISSAACAAPIPLRISGWTRPFNLPVMMELADGSYEKTFPEFGVSIVDMQSGPNLMASLEAGEVDIVQGIGDAAFLVSASAGVGAKIFAVNSRSPKAFAVVSNNPDVKTIKDLKGRRVAGLSGSVVHQVFVEALAENGIAESDVEFFPMPLANAASTLLAGKVDAALLVGGDIQRAKNAGATVLADGAGRVRGLSLVVIRTSFLREHPDVVGRFLAMRRATLASISDDPAAALAIAAKDIKQDVAAVEPMMPLYDFDCALSSEDISSMEGTKKYLTDSGILKKEVDVEAVLAR